MFVRRDIKCLLHFNWTLHPNFTPFSCAVYEWTSIKSCHVKDCMNGDMCVQVSRWNVFWEVDGCVGWWLGLELQCHFMSNTPKLTLSLCVFISLALHESCDDLSFQDFVRLFASAVSFSKPKWICSLQINFLNLMACQCQWAFKGWFFNVCVFSSDVGYWACVGDDAGREQRRYGVSESRKKQKQMKCKLSIKHSQCSNRWIVYHLMIWHFRCFIGQ